MTTNTYPRSQARSAILDSLRTQQPHPMFRKTEVKTVSQPQTAQQRFVSFAAADAAVAKVEPGRYALPRTTPDGSGNMINFFKVFSTRRGNMIRMLVATGGGDYTEVRLSAAHQIAAATHIAEDPMAALQLYGRETATCGRCGRALSNDASRAAGIGPECAKK